MSKLIINAGNKKSRINKEIYGHFSEHLGRCIYEGLYVGENSKIPNKNGMRTDVVNALKEMKLPMLRWPGGCFADEYHWRDGIGPKETRKKMINTHWGGVLEDNSFGTHEFLELCDQIGCQPYINGNLGSGTVQEMSEWIEYMTFDGVSPMADLRAKNGRKEPWKIKFFGVGNENWGCGGNMTPEYYANEYRRYQTYCRNYGDNRLFKIACGPNEGNYEWCDTVMRMASPYMDALSLHYYTIEKNWEDKGSATVFDEKGWYITLKKALHMEELVTRHSKIMDKYDPDKRVALAVDEWGCWFNVEPGTNPGFLYQQNTMRDALVAGINLNIFNKHSDRVRIANIAQLINVLQSVILTEGDKMLLTPTYHVFNMYKCHQDATLVDSYIDTEEVGPEEAKVPNLSESASVDPDGRLHITLNNLSVSQSYNINSILVDRKVNGVKAEILTNKMDAYNTFENPDKVHTEEFTEFKLTEGGLDFVIPPCSIIHFEID
ncbi:alpha-N-arabinofuranosidase [Anaerocolumna sp. MB42-C2]|uniref:alpha-N-arabinofuranosidase n=1 Tax=Anaerocolumna sp. MB42-C2 TaxID=3070997 RepID=UPI0027DEAEA8|nr:alpha-L-arabinofuranosidase C-terminal domain-containing protein [Anaerocolumna sp. MB42-C2]WMJ85606.1 alpha-L-arabinofuranosidase C-terminal domain-containing protein [Anaerocolumna sp. MB42-C2]